MSAGDVTDKTAALAGDANGKSVAVIAIHGVGDHERFAMPRDIAGLLTNLSPTAPGVGRYPAFTECVERIAVRPMEVGKELALNASGRNYSRMEAIANEPEGFVAKESDQVNSIDHLFMKGQLSDAQGRTPNEPGRAYEFLRVEGVREDGVGKKQVHLYEMYWADLSKLGNSFTAIFGELFQILFHLPSVALNNVLAAATQFQGDTRTKWLTYAKWLRWASAILVWGIPILNLYMAAMLPAILLAAVMRGHLSGNEELYVLVALAYLAGYGLLLAVARPARPRWFAATFMARPLLAAVMALLGWWISDSGGNWRDWIEFLCGLIVTAAAGLGIWKVIKAYDERRPGAKVAGKILGGAVVLLLSYSIVRFAWHQEVSNYPAIAVWLTTIELTFTLLVAGYLALSVVFAIAFGAGWRASRAVPKTDAERAGRVRWTARLSIAASTSLYIILTLAGWSGVIRLGITLLPGHENVASGAAVGPNALKPVERANAAAMPCQGPGCAPMTYLSPAGQVLLSAWNNVPWVKLAADFLKNNLPLSKDAQYFLEDPIRTLGGDASTAPQVSLWAAGMMKAAGLGLLPTQFVALLFLLVTGIWAVLPSALRELKSAGQELSSESRTDTKDLGMWLDQGFGLLGWGGKLIYLAVVLLTPLLFLPLVLIVDDWWLPLLGALVAGTAGLIGFSGRLNKAALGMRPAVRVMFDVDNWLREHPLGQNPTANIAGRYVSLLRHICRQGYKRLIIVAHSQGTVITADVLRYLRVEYNKDNEYDPALTLLLKGDLKVTFLSMGCPLRQLYEERFPYLYGYAGHGECGAGASNGGGCMSPLPDPEQLGVERWVNAYTSGDYVGRCLWHPDDCACKYIPAQSGNVTILSKPTKVGPGVASDASGKRIEVCIGEGAHMHYWDPPLQITGELLDELIRG